ncbi:MAG: DUF389 domain-containing protein [Oscillospiraceae bacterium]
MSKTTEKANEIDEGIEKEIKEKRNGLRSFFKDMLNMYDGMMSYQEIDDMMQENTVIHGPNMWILMLAALIASIGLNMNSTAVIIGAMLISPLMSGIMTMGYSLAVRDLRLLRRAFIRFGVQVIISLFSSTIYFLITPIDTPTAEMIARTSPTIWDVLIALFGGIAGAIGNTREKKSNVIPGVAIATALMPPLCTAGYGIATLQANFFFGALYLFLINTLFISLSTMIVMMLLRVPYHRNVSDKQQKKINRAVAAITIVVAVPSIFFGASTVISSVMDKNISDFLSQEFVFSGTSVVQSSADKSAKTVSVSLVGTTISDDVIAMLEQEMPKYGLDGYTLKVTQNQTIITPTEDNSDKITIALQESRIGELEQLLSRCEEEISGLQAENEVLRDTVDYNLISEKAAKIFPELENVRCGLISDRAGNYTLLIGETTQRLSESDHAHMKTWLETETGSDHCELLIRYTGAETEEAVTAETAEVTVDAE